VFDVSFGELIIISAVALVVIGPEKLPKVARTAGALLGRAQRFISTVKSDLDKEFQLAELAKVEAEIRAEASQLSQTIHQPLEEAKAALSEPLAPVTAVEDGPQGDLFAQPAATDTQSRSDRR
jgi:sec-independent protein translocase protein TatB